MKRKSDHCFMTHSLTYPLAHLHMHKFAKNRLTPTARVQEYNDTHAHLSKVKMNHSKDAVDDSSSLHTVVRASVSTKAGERERARSSLESPKNTENLHFQQLGNPLTSLDEGFRLVRALTKMCAEKQKGIPPQVAVCEKTEVSKREQAEN